MARNFIGWALILVGLALVIWASSLFRGHGTPVRPFERSTALVTDGPFRFSRNPMYLGLVSMLLGISTWIWHPGALVVIVAFILVIDLHFVRREEKFLEDIFGQEYREYRMRSRRWL